MTFAAKKRKLDDVKPTFETDFETDYPNGVELNRISAKVLRKNACKRSMTFDEITLEDQPVDFHPNDVRLNTWITRKIQLASCGLMSAPMAAVTEKHAALAMAKMGAIGILHRGLSVQEQCQQLQWVRMNIHIGGMIEKPVSFGPDVRCSELQNAIATRNYNFTSFPIVDKDNHLLGLITRDSMEFMDSDANPPLKDVMLPMEKCVVADEGTNTGTAYKIMSTKFVKKLPVLRADKTLIGLYVWSDVKNDHQKTGRFSLDQDGHFLVGAAVGVDEAELERAEKLVEAGCRLMVLDAAHGACAQLKIQLTKIRALFGDSIQIIAGNVASYASATYLLQGPAKPDAIKVGIGAGATGSTRTTTGHGIPQVTAIFEVWRAIQDYGKKTAYYVPVIADGGIRTSGDIVKCLACGANGFMLGSKIAGTTESPGQVVVKEGRKYKAVWGQRSAKGRGEIDGPADAVQGVQGLTLFTGSIEKVVLALCGGVQSGLAHTGAKTVPDFQKKAGVWLQSFAGVAEGRPHDISDIQH